MAEQDQPITLQVLGVTLTYESPREIEILALIGGEEHYLPSPELTRILRERALRDNKTLWEVVNGLNRQLESTAGPMPTLTETIV